MVLIFFWISLLIILEMFIITSTSLLLGSGICLLLIVTGSTMFFGLDLLGLTLLVVYSSIFLLLYLISLYFNDLYEIKSISINKNLSLIVILSFLILLINSVNITISNENIIWTDMYSLITINPKQIVWVIHNLLFKYFLIEAVFINIYILFGFISALFILSLIEFFNGLFNNSKISSIFLNKRSFRRSNSSIIKH